MSPIDDELIYDLNSFQVWEYYQDIRNATIYHAPADKSKWYIDNIFKNRNYRLRMQGWSVGGEGKLSSPLKEFRIDNDGRLLLRNTLLPFFSFTSSFTLIHQ